MEEIDSSYHRHIKEFDMASKEAQASLTSDTPKKRVTVLIGRFSPFHNGHADVLRRALNKSDKVLVLIGSCGQPRTIKNPFSYEERSEMIDSWYADEYSMDRGVRNPNWKLYTAGLKDHPYSDEEWVAQVRRYVSGSNYVSFGENHRDIVEVHLTGADRDDSCWYLSAFPEWKKDLISDPNHDYDLSATEVRSSLFNGDPWTIRRLRLLSRVPKTTTSFLEDFVKTDEFKSLQEEYDFVAKYKQSWSTAPYAPTFVTVDGVVLHSGHVLLVERRAAPGKGLWALPGGFVNQDERLEAAVIRELIEETCIPIKPEALKRAITDKEIFDLPGRSLRGRTITTAYRFELRKTGPLPEVKGSDDAAKAFWVPVNEALSKTNVWFEDHHAILETMVNRITTT